MSSFARQSMYVFSRPWVGAPFTRLCRHVQRRNRPTLWNKHGIDLAPLLSAACEKGFTETSQKDGHRSHHVGPSPRDHAELFEGRTTEVTFAHADLVPIFCTDRMLPCYDLVEWESTALPGSCFAGQHCSSDYQQCQEKIISSCILACRSVGGLDDRINVTL